MAEKNQNILVLATTFPRWKDDRTPKFVYELSKELDQRANKVCVLSPHHPDSAFREEMGGLKIYRYPYFFPLRYQTLREGSTVEKVQYSLLAKVQLPLLVISLIIHTLWLIHIEEISVIQSHWILPNGVVGSVISHLLGVPHVMTIHAGGALMLKKIPLNRRIATYTYRHSEAIMPVSNHIRETYENLINDVMEDGSKPIVVQPMGAHTSAFEEISNAGRKSTGMSGGKVVGLYVGRLAKKKGLTYLLEAATALGEMHDDFKLVIVGTGQLDVELRAQAAEAGIENLVEFTGWVSDEELNEWYVNADFVVVPSIETAEGDTEGMPTVISEAMASGNPVIATNVGGIPDIVDDGVNGFIVEQRQPSELIDRMNILIDNPSLRQQMSDQAVRTAETLDWSHCGEVYAEILRSVHPDPEGN